MTYVVIFWLLCAAPLLPSAVRARSADSGGSPEMVRLAKALAGDWSMVERVQHGQPLPKGAGRRGTTHVRLTGGGTALVSEGHSVGTVGGDLRWFIAIGGIRLPRSIAFSLASKRQPMPAANCGAPHIGEATHS